MKKALIITTISGFLTQFEMNDVAILKDLGYDIHYASNFNNPIYEIDYKKMAEFEIKNHHICIEKMPFKVIANIQAYYQLKKIIKREQFHMIHCHNPMGGVLGRMASGFIKRKRPIVVYTAHGFHFYKGAPTINWLIYYLVERILAGITDVLITVNKEDYDRANKFRIGKKGKVVYIPGVGVDISKFCLKEEQGYKKRKELGILNDMFVVLSVGELNDNKNHIMIIKAISKLKKENVLYIICGRGESNTILESAIKEYKVVGKVKLLGYRNDIPEILQCADCFAFPSKREGLGIAAIEAMCAGVPVIASDCRGTREYMKDGINGYICKQEVESYVEAITKLMNNKTVRKSMSQEGKKTSLKFSVEKTDCIMRKTYSELH